jgi:glycosyltransferase involved in cell wall biosynthesis
LAWDSTPSWAINGRFLTQRVTGVQRYACEIVAALDGILSEKEGARVRTRMRLVLPPGVEAPPVLSSIGLQPTTFGSGHAWDQLVLPRYAKAGLLSLGNFGPIFLRGQIVCIHDANVFIEPQSYSRTFGLVYRTLLPWIGRRASRIATVSRFSADMLVRFGVCRREKIFVAPNGHEHALRWDARRAKIPFLAALKRPFVLLLGSLARHKNVDIILEQAAALDKAGIDIVVVGAASDIFSKKVSAFQESNVHYAGYVGDDELAALYEAAICLAFPSRTEGFGIPPLEAMTRGCPVVASNVPSLLEVGGDAVAYVDPDHGNGWKEAIIGLSGNDGLRATMAARGRRRAELFSWKRSAQLYLDEIQRLRPDPVK